MAIRKGPRSGIQGEHRVRRCGGKGSTGVLGHIGQVCGVVTYLRRTMESKSVDAAQEHLLRLPFEVREEIADCLPLSDAKALSLTCQATRHACLRRLYSEIRCRAATRTFDWTSSPLGLTPDSPPLRGDMRAVLQEPILNSEAALRVENSP
jgi:hypothetical protein